MKNYFYDLGYFLELHITCPKSDIRLNGDLVCYFKRQYFINRRLGNSAKHEILEHINEINLLQIMKYVSLVQEDITKLITKWSIVSPQALYGKEEEFEKWNDSIKAEFLRQHEILIDIFKDRHRILGELSQYIIDLYPQVTSPSGKIIKRIKGLKERIRFQGSFNTLVTLFYGLYATNKISFNKENAYETEEIHFADFLENTFHYKKGKAYLPAAYTAVALARLREKYNEGGGDIEALTTAKKDVEIMLDDAIQFLSDYRNELRDLSFQKKSLQKK